MLLTFDDLRLDVLDEGSGPAIVLLHAFPMAKESWDLIVPALASHARVVRIDLRGLGRSSVPGGPYLMETLAGDVRDVLDALGIARAIIVGHSLGGFVAFSFFRMFGERCAGLGLVCSRATADDAGTAAARHTLATRAETEGMTPVAEAFLPRLFAPGVYVPENEMVARARAIIERTDPRGAAAMLRGMAARVDSADLFGEIAVPVRVIAGESDAIVSATQLAPMARAIAGAELDILKCGHMPVFEQPQALGDSLERLLSAAL